VAKLQLTRTQRALVGTVVTGAGLIASIGFAGSYAAVRQLALQKGFGDFALVFPIGLDAGIVVLLALDLLLTWVRMPFPLLRQCAWLLTIATIAFNASAAWPDPLGVGMHAVIPVLFVIVVEAARHAIGIGAEITADKRIDPVRLARWILAPWPTFRLWRRMKLWELRSYDEVIRLEQERLIYRARLRAEFGLWWRWSAPVEARLTLRLTRYGRALEPIESAPLVAAAPALELTPAPDRPAPSLPPALDPERPEQTERPAPEPESVPDPHAPERPEPEPEPDPEPEADAPRVPTRAEAKQTIRDLYDALGRRPLEGEMTAALDALTRYPFTSRQHANKLRREIEKKHPKLAALGAENVTPLTG
jgi:hypothetical protein